MSPREGQQNEVQLLAALNLITKWEANSLVPEDHVQLCCAIAREILAWPRPRNKDTAVAFFQRRLMELYTHPAIPSEHM